MRFLGLVLLCWMITLGGAQAAPFIPFHLDQRIYLGGGAGAIRTNITNAVSKGDSTALTWRGYIGINIAKHADLRLGHALLGKTETTDGGKDWTAEYEANYVSLLYGAALSRRISLYGKLSAAKVSGKITSGNIQTEQTKLVAVPGAGMVIGIAPHLSASVDMDVYWHLPLSTGSRTVSAVSAQAGLQYHF